MKIVKEILSSLWSTLYGHFPVLLMQCKTSSKPAVVRFYISTWLLSTLWKLFKIHTHTSSHH